MPPTDLGRAFRAQPVILRHTNAYNKASGNDASSYIKTRAHYVRSDDGVLMTTELIHRRLSLALQAILAAQVAAALLTQQWSTAFFTLGIIGITILPMLFMRHMRFYIPSQLQLLTIAIVFAALFLGEVRNYYTRFWWWDTALHAVTGFFMGIIGFLLMYIYGRAGDLEQKSRRAFTACFAFMFALGAGAIWEIGEFALDRLFDMNLQKSMQGDPSGLTDTMFDLIVDAIGAAVICLYGYCHMKNAHKPSFLERWIASFIKNNPDLLQRWHRNAKKTPEEIRGQSQP